VIGGNGFRAVGAIAALEQTLERPVVTANQALLWAALNAAGADPSAVTSYGRIFRTSDSQPAHRDATAALGEPGG
jgi:maleate isomerase